jgi:hypothetical protein
MNTLGSPYNIKLLLHYHCFADRPEQHDLQLCKDTTLQFLNGGLIKGCEDEGVYKTTPLGAAWVAVLCGAKCPTAAFVDEMGRVIEAS